MNRNKYLISLIVFLFAIFSVCGQNIEVKLTKNLAQDETLLSFSKEESGKVSGVMASGNISFKSLNGRVRIILQNSHGYEKMIYESFPLLSGEDGVDSFDEIGIETSELKGFQPDNILVIIKDAELSGLKFTISGLNNSRAVSSLSTSTITVNKDATPRSEADNMRKKFIHILNELLAKKGELWRAGDTPFSRLSYEEKKVIFGGEVPALNGAEYYIGGILDLSSGSDKSQTRASAYVANFDWRSRHGATINGSPYFQNEISGWITPVKNQAGCGSCWAFSATGAVEAVAKLFKNSKSNIDLSEQDLLSCSGAGNCTGGFAATALDYVRTTGIQDEASFKYKAEDLPCSDKLPPLYSVKISGKEMFNVTGNEHLDSEKLKSMLIKSPLAGRIGSWSHAMTLVGYKTLQVGDKIYITAGQHLTIQPGDPSIGKTAWIFKNSWGEHWGDNGFLYAFVDMMDLVRSAAPTLPFVFTHHQSNYPNTLFLPELRKFFLSTVAYDKDNDGYYWWGIGPRPNNLPSGAKWEADSDDSNASIGPMDQYGHPTLLKAYDLYIKDNSEDLGFEPNTTIQHGNFWSAPEVWVRHQNDNIEEHQNPKPNAKNYIKMRVWNRGKTTSKESRVIGYWSKAGTNLVWPAAWTGEAIQDGVLMGAVIQKFGYVPPIAPGESKIVTIEWETPNPEHYAELENNQIGGDNRWHFCLLLRIADKIDKDTHAFTPDIAQNVTNNNNVVQRNVTIKSSYTSAFEGTVAVYNPSSETKAYSLDLIEVKEPNQASIFSKAQVRLKMSPNIYSSWQNGGGLSLHLRSTNDPLVQEFISSNGALNNILLDAKSYTLVNLSVHFTSVLPWGAPPEKRTLLLRQKDEQGKIVGGETFIIVRKPRVLIIPNIDSYIGNESIELNVDNVNEPAEYLWYDSEGTVIGAGEKLTDLPLVDNTYKVEVTALSDGFRAYSDIDVSGVGRSGIMKVSPNPVKTILTVSYTLPKIECILRITALNDQQTYKQARIDSSKNEFSLNVEGLPQGIYVATIIDSKGKVIANSKFIKE